MFTGWTSSTSSSSSSSSSSSRRSKPAAAATTAKGTTRAKLYTKLKNSIRLSQASASKEPVSIDNYVVGDSTASCKSNIISMNNLINQTTEKLIEYHCILGLELTKYKLLSFVKFCSSCASDEYKALSCHRCVRLACNAGGLSCFMNFSCDTLNCTKDWVNFLITIGRLCKQFPKFKYTTLSLKQLKTNMKMLIESMTREEQFWQL